MDSSKQERFIVGIKALEHADLVYKHSFLKDKLKLEFLSLEDFMIYIRLLEDKHPSPDLVSCIKIQLLELYSNLQKIQIEYKSLYNMLCILESKYLKDMVFDTDKEDRILLRLKVKSNLVCVTVRSTYFDFDIRDINGDSKLTGEFACIYPEGYHKIDKMFEAFSD